jgi:copper homeostasis protein
MNPARITLEICTASVTDAWVAESAGADRVELNLALPLGGLTPSPGMVRLVLQQLSIPVIAMVRPRESGFCYSAAEFRTLQEDVGWLAEAGVAGIAFGVLTDKGEVDGERCDQVVQLLAEGQQAVFHRAFDWVPDPAAGLETLIQCGVTRVMTSGGAPSAWQGREHIRERVDQSAGRIEILAAGGIRSSHAAALVRQTGITQLHAGLAQPAWDESFPGDDVISFYSPLPADPAEYRRTSESAIRQMKAALAGVERRTG